VKQPQSAEAEGELFGNDLEWNRRECRCGWAAGAFRKWCRADGLSSLPVVEAHCDRCRDDLLFEIEADVRN